jgi:hypothetical protein
MDKYFEAGTSSSLDEYNATFVLTKTLYVTATTTVSAVIDTTATAVITVTATAATPERAFPIPHYPKADTAFTAVFGCLCLTLIIGTVFRKKSKKLKSFNIPLILGTFCKPLIDHF